MSKLIANQVNLKTAADLVAAIGSKRTVMMRGQPGIGKSSMLHMLAQRLPDYRPVYIDCANIDLGDIALPMIDHERGTSSFAPNERFGVSRSSQQPVLMMLDELTKCASPAVLNMLLPVVLERRLGDIPLPEGSIVFATGNLESDNVGDRLPAHAYNRMVVVDVANPTPEEWLQWASVHGVHEIVASFARQTPSVFDRYDMLDEEDAKGNPFIFNPRKGMTKAFVSPRSLAAASDVLHAFGNDPSIFAVLAGTVGEAAAAEIRSFSITASKLPQYEEVIKHPDTVRLPDDGSAAYIAAFRYAGRCKPEDVDALMTYLTRWNGTYTEALALAVRRMYTKRDLQALLVKNREFNVIRADIVSILI